MSEHTPKRRRTGDRPEGIMSMQSSQDNASSQSDAGAEYGGSSERLPTYEEATGTQRPHSSYNRTSNESTTPNSEPPTTTSTSHSYSSYSSTPATAAQTNTYTNPNGFTTTYNTFPPNNGGFQIGMLSSDSTINFGHRGDAGHATHHPSSFSSSAYTTTHDRSSSASTNTTSPAHSGTYAQRITVTNHWGANNTGVQMESANGGTFTFGPNGLESYSLPEDHEARRRRG